MVQENCVKPKIVVIAGPTAVGKSAFAVKLAKETDGEVISADSMQIYRGFDIGTGKITEKEREGVKHYMIDVVDPGDEYSVSEYVDEASRLIDDIVARGKTPIVCGGTGFYLNGLINGYNFSAAPKNEDIRNKWKRICEGEGTAKAYDELKRVDPVSAKQINPNDEKRVIRALEIYEITGKPRSEVSTEQRGKYDCLFVVIDEDRESLYERIDLRVDLMIKNGLVDEVKRFYPLKNSQAMQAIGYKEIVKYLDGLMSLDEAIDLIKKNTRNYAKRQMTFFRWIKTENKLFINRQELQRNISKIKDFLQK